MVVRQLRLVRIDKESGDRVSYRHWADQKRAIEKIARTIGMHPRKAIDRLQEGLVLETPFALYRFE